jgi:hypothetical protein
VLPKEGAAAKISVALNDSDVTADGNRDLQSSRFSLSHGSDTVRLAVPPSNDNHHHQEDDSPFSPFLDDEFGGGDEEDYQALPSNPPFLPSPHPSPHPSTHPSPPPHPSPDSPDGNIHHLKADIDCNNDNKTDSNKFYLPSKNNPCPICTFFSYEHPSDLCQWSRMSGRVHPNITTYYKPQTSFVFAEEDKIKVSQEDPKITKHFNKEDKSQSEYSQSSTQSLDSLESTVSFISASGEKNTDGLPLLITKQDLA